MTDTQPTSASAGRTIRLAYLAAFEPTRFTKAEAADPGKSGARTGRDEMPLIVRFHWACFRALLTFVGSTVVGIELGHMLAGIFGKSVTGIVATIVTGAMVLVWATQVVLDWELQPVDRPTFGQLLSKWLSRILYALGAALIVAGTTWSAL